MKKEYKEENMVEIRRKKDNDKCMTANGFLICYCGKCKPEQYKLPEDFKVIQKETRKFKKTTSKKTKVIAKCINCGRRIEPLCRENTDKELEDFYESNYECGCGIRIDWSNQLDYVIKIHK